MTELKIVPANETRHIIVLTDEEVKALRIATLRGIDMYNPALKFAAALRSILDKLPKLTTS